MAAISQQVGNKITGAKTRLPAAPGLARCAVCQRKAIKDAGHAERQRVIREKLDRLDNGEPPSSG
jgi:hypothetical protein